MSCYFYRTLIDDILRDVRYAVRTSRRAPGFTGVAILTLALGIGATTAIYSVVDTILLQPLPFAASDRVVRVIENVPARIAGRPPGQRGIGYPDFLEWRARARTLADAALIAPFARTVLTKDGTARVWGGVISSNSFTFFDARAALGRTFDPRDESNTDVVVLSDEAWRRLFHADRHIVGTAIELRSDWNGSYTPEVVRQLVTIVGVLPAAFELPTGPMDLFMPFSAATRDNLLRGPMIGRLRPGVSLQEARDEANAIGTAIRPPLPRNAPPLTVPRFDVQAVKDQLVRELRPALGVLLAAVVVVLLIVCANVANLLLARGTVRQHEIAVRLSVGAGRARIVRQLLIECVMLAIAGGVLGAVLAAGGVALVKELASVEAPGIFRFAFAASILPRAHEIAIEPKMFGMAFAIAAMTILVFGLAPAVHLSRTDVVHALRTRSASAGRRDSRLRAALVVAQLTMATVLLVGAGLLMRSFVQLLTVEKGYDPSHVLAFQLVLPPDYPIARRTEAIESVLRRTRSMPDVEAAGFTRAGVLVPEEIFVGTFVPHGRTVDEMRADPVQPRLRPVSNGYLTAMGMRLVDGREFEASDAPGSMPAVVISRTVAQRFFGSGRAAGQVVDWHVARRVVPVQIVGVVEDVRNESPERAPNPDVFIEYRQLLAQQEQWGDSPHSQAETTIGFLSFAIRTRRDPAIVAPRVAAIVHRLDPNAGIDAMLPMDRLVSSAVARPRFYAVLLGVFAAVAGALAAIGIYGVLAYAVEQRAREIGIRMALGAARAHVLALVLRRGLALTALGIALGLAGAAAASRLLQGMLFGVTPLDVRTFAIVAAAFGGVATLASFVPARRATRVDPLIAIRTE
jgi:putative ABC transport system permease protein